MCFYPHVTPSSLAVPRGGGEYGEEWHTGGTLSRKQNVFDDFAAAARYLAAEGYTTKDQLAIMGGSNGGLVSVLLFVGGWVCRKNPERMLACFVAAD